MGLMAEKVREPIAEEGEPKFLKVELAPKEKVEFAPKVELTPNLETTPKEVLTPVETAPNNFEVRELFEVREPAKVVEVKREPAKVVELNREPAELVGGEPILEVGDWISSFSPFGGPSPNEKEMSQQSVS